MSEQQTAKGTISGEFVLVRSGLYKRSCKRLIIFNFFGKKKAICVHKSKYGLGAFAAQNIVKNSYVGGKFEGK